MFILHKFFPIQKTLITNRRISNNSKRMFDPRVLIKRAKTSIIFSLLITFTAIIFLIQSDGVIYHYSSTNKEAPIVLSQADHTHDRNKQVIRSTLTTLAQHKPLRSMQEENKDDEVDDVKSQRVLVAPLNVSEEKRIAWFKGNLQEFKILKSDKLTRQFHARILGFFNNHDQYCEYSKFFMTWFSPASSFGARELFSIESLFKVHPHACLTILSRTLDSVHGYRILKPFLDRGFKVQAVTPDLLFLLKGTPTEAWFNELRKGKKDPGEIPLFQNLSNLIRLVVLYKYGGVYLDTDFILLKSLTGLRNCIGAQSMDFGSKHWTRLNNAVLIFDMNHPLLLRFIKEFGLTFDGNKWGHNGPYLVSRVVERLGKKRQGFNFTILPPLAFYPVNWNKIGGFFRKPKTRGEAKWVEAKLLQLGGETYGVHLWNKQSSGLMIEEGSVIARLVSNHCVICNSSIALR